MQVIKSQIDRKLDLSEGKRIVSAMENPCSLRIAASAGLGPQPKTSTFSPSFSWVKRGVVDCDKKFLYVVHLLCCHALESVHVLHAPTRNGCGQEKWYRTQDYANRFGYQLW